MRAQLLLRKVHYWLSIVVAAPLLLVICTGLLLQVKKDFHWIQPPEQLGGGLEPIISFGEILACCSAIPQLSVTDWDDVQRVEYRPSKSLLKITSSSGWEAQLDPADGRLLQIARRRSDVIESLHDGSWFGEYSKRWLFLPSGVFLLVLWVTGMYLFLLPQMRRRRSKRP